MVKKLGYFVAVLIFIVLAGAGWFFSGVIYEGALNPEFNDTASIGTAEDRVCLLYTSPSPRDLSTSRMPSSA